MKKQQLSTDGVNFTVCSKDNGGEENGKIFAPDFELNFCERWDNELQEIIIDVELNGDPFCMVYDHGDAFFATSASAFKFTRKSDSNKFKAIVQVALKLL